MLYRAEPQGSRQYKRGERRDPVCSEKDDPRLYLTPKFRLVSGTRGRNQPSVPTTASCFDDLGEYIPTNIHLSEQILMAHDRQYPVFLAYTRHIYRSARLPREFRTNWPKILPYINIRLIYGKSHPDRFRSNGLMSGTYAKYCIYASSTLP